MISLFKRELKAYLKSVSAYLFGAILMASAGAYAIYYNLVNLVSNFEYPLQAASLFFLIAVPVLSLKVHARIHADRLVGPENLSKDGLSLETEPVKTKSFSHMHLLKPSEADLTDGLFYRKGLLEGTIRPVDLTIARALALAVVLLIPVLILHLYPVIMIPFGEVYLPTAYGMLWAYFGLGLVYLMTMLLVVTRQKHPLLSLIYTILVMIAIFTIHQVALWAYSAYSGMLFFTLVILLIALALYLLYHNTFVALAAAAVLEVVQLVFFVINRDAFEGLAIRVLSRLSPVVRFEYFTGGILDIPALVYFLLLSAVLVVLVTEQVRQKKEAYQLDVEAAEKAKASAANKFKTVKAPKLSEQAEDDQKAAERKAADMAALKRAVPAFIACGIVLVIMLGLSLTRTSLIFDTTSTNIYKEDDRFRKVLDAVSDDVTVYWICQNSAEDATLQTSLYYYSRQNPNFHVQKIEPLSHVEFLQTYIVESISNNALLLRCGERSRYIPWEELYTNDYSRYDQTGLPDLAFQLENMLGHGLEYVSGKGMLPTLYEVTGQDETPLTDYWKVMIQKLDMAVSSCELTSIPEGAEALLIFAPKKDLTDEEVNALRSYLEKGGQLMLVTAAEEDPNLLANLKALMATYGVETVPGIVMESSSYVYSADSPYSFFPRMLVHLINEEGAYSDKAVLFSEVQALTLKGADGVSLTPLLLSSEESYSKVDGYSITTYEKENRDIDGPLTLAALAEKGDTKIVWVGTASLLAEDANEIVEGGNRYFLNGVLRFFGADQGWEAIDKVRHNYGVMNADETLASRLGLVFAGVFPVFYLLIGGTFWALKKRREMMLQAEAEEAAQKAAEEARRREEEEAEAKREAFRKARREAAIKAKEQRARESRKDDNE